MHNKECLKNCFIYFVVIALLISCTETVQKEREIGTIFQDLSAEDSGLDFTNILTENDSLNYFTYQYLYMGGGIAAGDINNDGLVDLYFTGNQVSNKLFLNKGGLKFEDVTSKANVGGDNRWYTGVTMADVNADGYLDIYCSVSGKFAPRENQFFINNQDGTFTEKAKVYGLADAGSSVQSTFFDYDKDGDLDLFVANYPPTKFNSPAFVYQMKMKNVKAEESDHLYRNDGDFFTEVSKEAGVQNFALSLSATIGDLNNDTWPDIYVSNDFSSPDFMYINNQDGTFREVVKKSTAHTSFYGMGADIADFNNDGNLDIFQVDMDAQNNRRQKANMASMNIDLFWSVVDAGFHYQYMQNCMQMNTGVFEEGNPYFSNVSRMTGTSSTDWSWGPLFADFDNDGLKDLFVSNGTRREINNNDYFKALEEEKIKPEEFVAWSQRIPTEKIDNFIFKNNGNLDFERANEAWGISYEGFSNGVVYADLDNDGDLEIVTNNIDDTASVFENRSSEVNNYLQFAFKGNDKNPFGMGCRVYVSENDNTQMQELTLTRGFQSSVAPNLHFGLGTIQKVDQVKVVWADGKVNILKDVSANQKISISQKEAVVENKDAELNKEPIFSTSDSKLFPEFRHIENDYDDFQEQVLLPHQMSALGPALAVGDLNGDGLDDYFIGGSSTYTGSIFFQNQDGFVKGNDEIFKKDSKSEDIAALIFDADFDGDNDLYVTSGGYEFDKDDSALQDRLYINNENEYFTKSVNALPNMPTSSSRVYAADFNKDGQSDLLVLGRQVPKAYPMPTTSYVLINKSQKGEARFEKFAEEDSFDFKDLGMATSAVITDFNEDGWEDIIIVGEWMPIKVFRNSSQGFIDVSNEMGLGKETTGWWNSINQGDFDNDGDTDYILGNNGLNYKYKATKGETFDIYLNDFDKDTNLDIVLGYYSEGKQYPVRGRECSSQQIPGIKQKFKNYQSFSEATLVDVYTESNLNASLHYQVESFESIYLENKNGQFISHSLPAEAQVSSINQILVEDFDNDGFLDALIAGNLYASEVETPRNDAGHGLFLKGNGLGEFIPLNASDTGFFTPGDVKDLGRLQYKGDGFILVAKNNEELQYIKIKE